MSTPPTVTDPAQAMTQVRMAYRLVHAYHRRVFDLITLARDAVANQHGALPKAWWSNLRFDDVPKAASDPTTRWVYDFVPLQHGRIRWASVGAPTEAGFCIGFDHRADTALADAVERVTDDTEPDVSTLGPVDGSKTTLEAWVLATTACHHAKWDALLEEIDAGPASGEDGWQRPVAVHELTSAVVAFGGFELSVADLWTRADVESRLAAPLVKLVGEARAALPDKPKRRRPKA